MILIERIWFDTLENHPNDAVGYSVVGYVETLEEAELIVSNGKTYTYNDCWAIGKDETMKQFRYKIINKFKDNK